MNAVPLPAGVTRDARGCLGRSTRWTSVEQSEENAARRSETVIGAALDSCQGSNAEGGLEPVRLQPAGRRIRSSASPCMRGVGTHLQRPPRALNLDYSDWWVRSAAPADGFAVRTPRVDEHLGQVVLLDVVNHRQRPPVLWTDHLLAAPKATLSWRFDSQVSPSAGHQLRGRFGRYPDRTPTGKPSTAFRTHTHDELTSETT